jgi:hypothetical protein
MLRRVRIDRHAADRVDRAACGRGVVMAVPAMGGVIVMVFGASAHDGLPVIP